VRVTGSDGNAKKDTRIIPVRDECPYVQFERSRVLAIVCIRGYKRAREGIRLPSLCVAWVGVCV